MITIDGPAAVPAGPAATKPLCQCCAWVTLLNEAKTCRRSERRRDADSIELLARRLLGSPASGGEGAAVVPEAVHPRSPVNAQASTKLGANRPNCSRMSKQKRIRELAALPCTIAAAAGVFDCHRVTAHPPTLWIAAAAMLTGR